MTKRHRLYHALAEKQKADNCGNNIIAFITKGPGCLNLSPSRMFLAGGLIGFLARRGFLPY